MDGWTDFAFTRLLSFQHSSILYIFDCLCRLFAYYLLLLHLTKVAYYLYLLTLTSKSQILHDLCLYRLCINITSSFYQNVFFLHYLTYYKTPT